MPVKSLISADARSRGLGYCLVGASFSGNGGGSKPAGGGSKVDAVLGDNEVVLVDWL